MRPALPRRAGRRTNLALLGLLLLAFVTGVLAYGVGTPTAATVVVAMHGAAGLGLVLLIPWKAVIVRRSWPHAASTRALAASPGVDDEERRHADGDADVEQEHRERRDADGVQDAGQHGDRNERTEPGRQRSGARGVGP